MERSTKKNITIYDFNNFEGFCLGQSINIITKTLLFSLQRHEKINTCRLFELYFHCHSRFVLAVYVLYKSKQPPFQAGMSCFESSRLVLALCISCYLFADIFFFQESKYHLQPILQIYEDVLCHSFLMSAAL